jgi:hypothetical protein
MLRSIPRFNSEAQYVLAKARPLGPCNSPGDIVPVAAIGVRRASQAAEQNLILPTHVQVVQDFALSAERKLKAGEIVASEELGAAILKRYLGLKLTPVPPPAETITPAAAGRRKVR